MTERIRDHFCCLPYQISHFNLLAEVPARIGLGGWTNGRVFAAYMDDDGHIYLDSTHARELGELIVDKVDCDHLDAILESHKQLAQQLETRLEARVSTGDSRPALREISQTLVALAPYGLVTKILPDALRTMIQARIDQQGSSLSRREIEEALRPGRNGSSELCRYLSRVAQLESGCTGADRDAIVHRICEEFCGFGPHAWEAPGYENKALVTRILDEWQAGSAGNWTASGAARAGEPAEAITGDTTLARMIEHFRYWAAYVDDQSTLLRKGFYRGLRPLLSQLAAELLNAQLLERPSDILFLTRQELEPAAAIPPRKIIAQRRRRYEESTRSPPYPVVSPQRLERLIMDLPCDNTEADESAPGKVRYAEGSSAPLIMHGSPAAASRTISGYSQVVSQLQDIFDVRPGAIVLARLITPDMAPLFLRIAGVVVQEGGLTQHATLLAREYNLPCIIGVENVTQLIPDGSYLTMSGASGEIMLARGPDPGRGIS